MTIYTKKARRAFKVKQTKTGEQLRLQRHIALFDAKETIANFQNPVRNSDIESFDNETKILLSLGLTSFETAEVERKGFLTQAQQAETKLHAAKRTVFGVGYTTPEYTQHETEYNTAQLDDFLFAQGFLSQI